MRGCTKLYFAGLYLVAVSIAWSLPAEGSEPAPRPNILFVIADDWSFPHASVYGGGGEVSTPNFDRVAREGVLFTHAFAAAPSCTTSRAAILTGQAIHRLGPGGDQSGILPAVHRVYPDALEEAGYFVGYTGKGWAPGNVKRSGRKRNPAGPQFDSFADFLRQRPEGKPFCFWYGSFNPHRPYDRDSGVEAGMSPKAAPLPPFLPNDDIVRRDLLDYLLEVQRFDDELGKLLEALEGRDLIEETVIVATSDQGMPFPRSKTNLYDSGTRIPLAVMWKGKTPGNREVHDLVGQTDFAPTFLEVAGVEPWSEMTGRSLVNVLTSEKAGCVDLTRDHVFVERERHGACREGDKSYPVRGIRTKDFLYLRNLRPDLLPAGDPMFPTGIGPFGDMDPGPTKDFLLAHRHDPEVEPCFKRSTSPRRPEELYDCETDPYQLENLAEAADFAEVKTGLRRRLDRWMEATRDPRAHGETDLWDKALYVGSRATPEQREKIRSQWIKEEEEARRENSEPEQPSIVVVLADDMGFSDLGCYGGEISTPHLDRLAAGGIRFTQFYNAARCCPTRAAILTGLYPHQSGVGHMSQDWKRPAYRGKLNDTCLTIGEALRPAGYRTLISGKWHVGEQRGCWPLDRGFDRFYGTPQGGGHYFRMLPGRQLVLDAEVIEPKEGWFSTDAFTDRAIEFIRESVGQKKPFFCYLAFFSPHYPLQARPEDIAPYLGKYREGWTPLREARLRRQIEMGIMPSSARLSSPAPAIPDWDTIGKKEEMDRRMAVYAAQVSNMDRGIGRLVAALQEAGQLENTLIMFLSDNGADAAGGPFGFTRKDRGDAHAVTGAPNSYASYGMSWANLSNAPFRNYKGEIHEGGIASPLIVHWPTRVRNGGTLCRQVGHVIDLMPTCLDAAGATYPAKRGQWATIPLEGMSLLPAFEGAAPEPRTLCWEHMGNRGIRHGQWKLVALSGRPWELYDLDADPTETKDMAGSEPDRANDLAQLYEQWAERCAVLPWEDTPLKDRRTPSNTYRSTTK